MTSSSAARCQRLRLISHASNPGLGVGMQPRGVFGDRDLEGATEHSGHLQPVKTLRAIYEVLLEAVMLPGR